MADTERTTLYAPDGRPVSVLLPTVITRLKSRGYSEHPPKVLHLPVGALQTRPPAGDAQGDGAGPAGAAGDAQGDAGAAVLAYDPSEHTVRDVEKFIRDNPELTDQVIAAERAGRNRSSLTGDDPADDPSDA